MKYIILTCFLFSITTLWGKDTYDVQTKGYQFKENWFDYNIPVWTKFLKEYKGKKSVVYVEVGAYEGRSFFWALDNILTQSQSKAYAIDLFENNGQYQDNFTERFFINLKKSGHEKKVIVLKGNSHNKLLEIKPETVDIVYIDGSHLAYDVFTDIADSWRLLKRGGILILDDYLYTFDKKIPIGATPRLAIDSFLTAFGGELKLLHKDAQVLVQKLERPCHGGTIYFIGQKHFCFYYEGLTLLDRQSDKFVPLTRSEQSKLLELSYQRSFGQEKGDEKALSRELPELYKKLSGGLAGFLTRFQ